MLLATIILAVEEDPDSIALLPDAAELIWGFFAFGLLMLAIIKFVFPKLNQTLEDRSAAIQGKLEEADSKLADAEEAKRRYEESIADAQGDANRIVEEAKASADALRAEARERAEAEAQHIIERAQADVSAERDRALQELRTQVGAISVELASRIVERELDDATHAGLVDEYIQRLSNQN
jgi:F-type H+-transporting ATPase subunit b